MIGTPFRRILARLASWLACSLHFYPNGRALSTGCSTRGLGCRGMHVQLDSAAIEVRLSWWQKVLGLMGNIRVERGDISDVEVVDDPVRAAMGTGLKAGLRLPWVVYIARTIRLDQAFVVRRGVPGLSFAVANHRALKHVLVSAPDAAELARRLRSGD
jgi:hypothetical protein